MNGVDVVQTRSTAYYFVMSE